MKTPSDLREKYGSCYVTELPDGQLIAWKPLSLKEFIEYTNDFIRGLIAPAVLEKEIFCQCVIDKFIVENIDKQKAGSISTVVAHILEASGVNSDSINLLNYHLNLGRLELVNNPYHEMAGIICVAFPAYKPEDVYNLNFETFKLRLAQAEQHLLRIGYLQEPLKLESKGAETEEVNTQAPPQFRNNELKSVFERQQHQEQQLPLEEQYRPPNKRVKEDITPKQKNKTKDGRLIITKEEMHVKTVVGDMDEAPYMEHQMLEDAAVFYKDYLEDVKAGKKVIIKTPEERLKEKKMKEKSRPSKLKKTAGK